jgi:toxin CcdB
MAQYDVYPAPVGGGYLLDVQTDWIAILDTRIVVPLVPEGTVRVVAKGMNPRVEVDGDGYVLATQLLAAVPAAMLRTPRGNLSGRAEEITRALDLVLHGF